MKKNLTLFPLLSVTLLISPMLKAADFRFEPRVITGVMYHEYEGLHSSDDVADYMPFFGLGATLSYDRFFVDAYIQKSGEGEDGNTTLSREDDAIAFGYAVTDNFSISVGYRKGTTDFEKVITSSLSGDTFVQKNDFTSKGPFIGAAYGWPIGDGLLGMNVAFTILETDYHKKVESIDPIDLNADSTIGTSIGVHWKAPITKQLSYGASLDYYNYSFESSNSKLESYGYDNEIEENFLTLRASLSYRF